MIARIYLFIFLGTLLENCHWFFRWMGYSEEYVYYTIFLTCQRAEIALLPLWWVCYYFWPVEVPERRKMWLYLIASTYFIFQLVDVIDMATNGNERSAILDFGIFIILNISYWLIFRNK